MGAPRVRRGDATGRLTTGQTVAGRYRVGGELGTGRLGLVYTATDRITGKEFALKAFHPEFSADEEFAAELARVTAVVGSIGGDPRIVALRGWDQAEDGTLLLIMDFVNGRSLKTIVQEQGALPMERALRVAGEVAKALKAAHGSGVVHGDVRPEHVLLAGVGAEETIKLKGFETAALLTTHVVRERIRAGLLSERAEYLAPEQIGHGAVSSRTDIYRYGIVLYEVLIGDVPFTGATADDVRRRQLHDVPLPPRALRGDLSPLLEREILQALQKQPDRRQDGIEDVMNDQLAEMCSARCQADADGVLRRVVARAAAFAGRVSAIPTRWAITVLALWLLVSLSAAWWLFTPRPSTRPVSQTASRAAAPMAANSGGPEHREQHPDEAVTLAPASLPPAPEPGPAASDGSKAKPRSSEVTTGAAVGSANAPTAQKALRKPAPSTGAESMRARERERMPAGAVQGEHREGVSADGTAIIDWLFDRSSK